MYTHTHTAIFVIFIAILGCAYFELWTKSGQPRKLIMLPPRKMIFNSKNAMIGLNKKYFILKISL